MEPKSINMAISLVIEVRPMRFSLTLVCWVENFYAQHIPAINGSKRQERVLTQWHDAEA